MNYDIAAKITVPCSKCGKEFKERAKKIRGEATLNCLHCGETIAFDGNSPDGGIRKALNLARKMRSQILTQ
jgi:DNA-directed RNA polymerase subunit RPC12/RpoP